MSELIYKRSITLNTKTGKGRKVGAFVCIPCQEKDHFGCMALREAKKVIYNQPRPEHVCICKCFGGDVSYGKQKKTEEKV